MGTLPLLVSPPGMGAPLDLANYTPDLGMMHPAGTVSPKGSLQITPMGPKHMDSLRSAIDAHGKKQAPPKQADAKPPTETEPSDAALTAPTKLPSAPSAKPRMPSPKLRPPRVY